MDRSTTLHFTKPLLRQAVRGFWWRVVGFRFLLALVLVATGLIMAVQRGDTSWLVGVLGSVCALGIGFAVALYVVHYRNSVNKLHAMGRPHATLEVCDSQMTVSSGAGTSSFPWATVTEVWQFNTCWLLVLSKSQFLTLPLADLPPELAAFLLARVRAAGGKVS